MRTNGRIAAFDIEMLFLQYVVSCIIENRNAFSDSLFIYSVVFHYRTPAGSQKRHRLFFFFKRTVTPKLRRKIRRRHATTSSEEISPAGGAPHSVRDQVGMAHFRLS
jgi:hypothetical protein